MDLDEMFVIYTKLVILAYVETITESKAREILETTRKHDKGDPFIRWGEVPQGWQSKTAWAKAGYIPKPGSKPGLWVLLNDNLHEVGLFHESDVTPGKVVRGKPVTDRQIMEAFERLRKFVRQDCYFELQLDTGSRLYWIDWMLFDQEHWKSLGLSGSVDHNGRHKRGSLAEALRAIEGLIKRCEDNTRPALSWQKPRE